MADQIWKEENEKLAETVQRIDEMIDYRQGWMNKTKDEVGGRETQVKQRELFEKERGNLIKARPSPYYGRVDFILEDKADTAETYYIGRMWVPLDYVYSWDSPIAELYRDLACNEYEFGIKIKNRLLKNGLSKGWLPSEGH